MPIMGNLTRSRRSWWFDLWWNKMEKFLVEQVPLLAAKEGFNMLQLHVMSYCCLLPTVCQLPNTGGLMTEA